ncbi:glycosyltransferase family A protein [Acidiphilium sp.]|uniref:glycosyltransferase family A protein n=1 Tax=Acidiphilium sp. TaxID=527 RepID=UPI003D01175A
MKVFILSRNRPIYLWACLDSLYRLTRTPCQFILIDSASDDHLVRPVIEGFERRGMLQEVVWLRRNEAALVREAIIARLDAADDCFAFIESDVVLLAGSYACWLARMAALLAADPALALLGSLVDADDFVPLERARAAAPHLTELEIRDITHHHDPERQRHRPAQADQLVFSPHNPAGRLLLVRTAAIQAAGAASDADLHERLLELGFSTAISTEVRHRHLSLLNIFDYPAYDMQSRNAYMYSQTYKAQAEQAILASAERAGQITTDPDLHIEADGVRIDALREGGRYRFVVPDAARLTLVSRRGFALQSLDRRPLGVSLASLVLDGRDMLMAPSLVRGWHPGEAAWRWTAGRAELPRSTIVELTVAGSVTYFLGEDS